MAMALPEAACMRDQMADALTGRTIADVAVVDVTRTNGQWRFGSIDQAPGVFRRRLLGGEVIGVDRVANSLFINASTGHALVLGYISGRVLYHPAGLDAPAKSSLCVRFADGSHLSVTVTLWGLIRAQSPEERPAYVAQWYGSAIEPNSKGCTLSGFRQAVRQTQDPRLSVKKFLHAFGPGFYLSGIDSGYAIEILHRAGIHPKRLLRSLNPAEQAACYRSANRVMKEAIRQGGRASEVDLYGRPGRFVPHVCEARLGQPCLECGTPIVKFAFEGGACYVCPTCQPL